MWLVNKSDKTIEYCCLDEKKWFYFKPNVPIFVKDTLKAINLISKYRGLRECKDPESYFVDTPLKRMVVRDAGIGDLLLLEPILRKARDNKNIELSVLTRFPGVYLNNPYIDHVHEATTKESLSGLKIADYDEWIDLRSYSETAKTRATKHRTDVYNEKFNFDIRDVEKEPRIYFSKNEEPYIKKQKGKNYIGISVDASHEYRKYDKEKELVNHLILKNKNNIVVLIGTHDGNEYKKNKQIMDLRKKTSIREMINCVRCLDSMIAVDSGIMHVALSLHIPTVCLFTIITPSLRLKYYTGKHVAMTANVPCVGCGNFHMANCKSNKKLECQNISVESIYNELIKLGDAKPLEIKKDDIKINVIKKTNLLTMPIIVQNEEKNLPRFIENVIKHDCIGRVIAIDGGSTDKTVEMLRDAGAEVYIHPYIREYHEQQAMQRNISCSYVKDGERIIIMDVDECFSKELSEHLLLLCNTHIEYGLISRKTFNYYSDIKNPSKQIKDYPDWQPRFYIWNRKYKFVGGAHHITLNCPPPVKIQKDILHFESEGKDRKAIETQWSNMMAGVKKYT